MRCSKQPEADVRCREQCRAGVTCDTHQQQHPEEDGIAKVSPMDGVDAVQVLGLVDVASNDHPLQVDSQRGLAGAQQGAQCRRLR